MSIPFIKPEPEPGRYQPKEKEIKVNPENIGPMKEKLWREELHDVEEYCRKNNLPLEQGKEMVEKLFEKYPGGEKAPEVLKAGLKRSEERVKLGQTRTASERKELKDREIKVNPEQAPTIAVVQEVMHEIAAKAPEGHPSLTGRVKPSSQQG